MARRRRRRRRDWKEIALYIITLLVALSMALGIVISILLRPS
ncbi:MAG: hypothetical protein ACE5MB_11035 [Anaerolineae bacterium]